MNRPTFITLLAGSISAPTSKMSRLRIAEVLGPPTLAETSNFAAMVRDVAPEECSRAIVAMCEAYARKHTQVSAQWSGELVSFRRVWQLADNASDLGTVFSVASQITDPGVERLRRDAQAFGENCGVALGVLGAGVGLVDPPVGAALAIAGAVCPKAVMLPFGDTSFEAAQSGLYIVFKNSSDLSPSVRNNPILAPMLNAQSRPDFANARATIHEAIRTKNVGAGQSVSQAVNSAIQTPSTRLVDSKMTTAQEHEIARAEIANRDAEARGLVSAGRVFVKEVLGNSQAADDFAVAGSAVIAVTSAIQQYANDLIGPLAMGGIILNSASLIMGLFAQQPDPTTIILNAIRSVDKHLKQFAEETRRTLYEIEIQQVKMAVQLADIAYRMSVGNRSILGEIANVRNITEEIRSLVDNGNRSLLFANTLLVQRDQARIRLRQLPMDSAAVDLSLADFVRWATKIAATTTFIGDYTYKDNRSLLTTLASTPRVDLMFGLMPAVVKYLQLPVPTPILPSPTEWARGAQAYLETAMAAIVAGAKPDVETDVLALLKVGAQLQTGISALTQRDIADKIGNAMLVSYDEFEKSFAAGVKSHVASFHTPIQTQAFWSLDSWRCTSNDKMESEWDGNLVSGKTYYVGPDSPLKVTHENCGHKLMANYYTFDVDPIDELIAFGLLEFDESGPSYPVLQVVSPDSTRTPLIDPVTKAQFAIRNQTSLVGSFGPHGTNVTITQRTVALNNATVADNARLYSELMRQVNGLLLLKYIKEGLISSLKGGALAGVAGGKLSALQGYQLSAQCSRAIATLARWSSKAHTSNDPFTVDDVSVLSTGADFNYDAYVNNVLGVITTDDELDHEIDVIVRSLELSEDYSSVVSERLKARILLGIDKTKSYFIATGSSELRSLEIVDHAMRRLYAFAIWQNISMQKVLVECNKLDKARLS